MSESRKIRAERSSRGGEIILTDLAVRRTSYFFLVLMRRVKEGGGGGEEGRVRAGGSEIIRFSSERREGLVVANIV